MSLCPLIYNNKQGIKSSGVNNEYWKSVVFKFQLTRQSFLMHTELPTLLNVFETDYELPADKNKHK